MSSHGLRGLKHKSVNARRRAWRMKLRRATGRDFNTITQCRNEWRKLTAPERQRVFLS